MVSTFYYGTITQDAPMSIAIPCKDLGRPDNKRSKSQRLVTPNDTHSRSSQDDTYLVNQAGQEQWEREMRNITQMTERKVAVLLFSWEKDQAHSMNTTAELNGLTNVFENKYNFQVCTKLLSTKNPQPPRYQLNSIFNDFLSEHDKPGTLLIIYYGGHGMPSDNDEELRLMGGNPDEKERGSTELNWSDVEPTLYRLRADLLLIFDCCYAGLVARNKRVWPASRSHFEFIASTAFDKTARGPKSSGSFTRAMIEVLNNPSEDEEFTTAALVHQISRSKIFRKSRQQPFAHECGKANSLSRLRLMPQEKQCRGHANDDSESDNAINFYLHLKYVFRGKPNDVHLKALADRLDDMIRYDQLPIANVLWDGLSEYNPRMRMGDAARMLQACLGHRTHDKPAGRLEISATTEKPQMLLQRSLTTLTMDDGPPHIEASHKADLHAHIPEAPFSSNQVYQIATIPVIFRPVCTLSKAKIYFTVLALSSTIICLSFSHTFWPGRLR